LVSIVFCTLFLNTDYIRAVGLSLAFVATLVIVCTPKFGRSLWFWLTMVALACCHAAAIAVVNPTWISGISPVSAIAAGIVDVVVSLCLIAIAADRFQHK